MKGKKPIILSMILALTFSLSTNTVLAEITEPASFNLQSAVRTGLNNSILLQQLDNKVILSNLKVDAYDEIADDLKDGRKDLGSGESAIDSSMALINSNQDTINQAKVDILNGVYPQGFPDVTIVPGALVIKAGDDIAQKVTDFNTATGAGLNVAAIVAQISKGVNRTLKDKQAELDDKKVEYEEGLLALVDGKIDYKVARTLIASNLAEKLDMSSLDGLTTADETALLYKMADAAAKVTVASKGIYKNQIALLIENSYYNVLKAKKLAEVKERTMKRAESQYQFAKDGYESGMKAKDDMILANIYYTGTKLEYQKAQYDYYNAAIELKKNMNIPLDQAITLEDVTVDNVAVMDYESGLKNGLGNRLEIIKAMQMEEVYKLNMSLVQSDYKEKKDQYSEALYLRKNAGLEVEKAKKEVESSIRQSYNTLMCMDSILATAKDMVSQAQECVDIAQEKYKEGFGTDSSLLKSLNLESASGTVLEVISAEENLAKVEEKYIEIRYGYNLAKEKYLNDIGYLTY